MALELAEVCTWTLLTVREEKGPLPGKVTYGPSFAGRADCREKVSINAGTAVAHISLIISSSHSPPTTKQGKVCTTGSKSTSDFFRPAGGDHLTCGPTPALI